MTEIWIKVQLQPTEDKEKVIKAIRNLFGDLYLNHDDKLNIITGKIDEISQLKELRTRIAMDRIRTTIYNTLTRWVNGENLSFGFNRQAAYAGHVSLNLINEDPMGPIQVQIHGNVEEVIDFLCK